VRLPISALGVAYFALMALSSERVGRCGNVQRATNPQSQLGEGPPPAGQPAIEPIQLSPALPIDPAKANSKHRVEVTGDGWQSTSIALIEGDNIEFHATGEMTLSDGHTTGPDGIAHGWTDLLRLYPMSSADSGALIGRIGAGDAALPFLIGANRTWTASSGGLLYLRANLSPDLTGEGSFQVSIRVQTSKILPRTSPSVSAAFFAALSPSLFSSIPRRVHDRQGDPGDMVNFALVGTEEQVQADLTKAGWFPTDADTQDALLHGLLNTLSREAYKNVPMSTLYLFGRPQDLAYARGKAIEVAATRNHMRLWKTTKTVDRLPLWVGSATRDHGFETDQRTGGVTHHIDPNIDAERDFILASLNDAGQAMAAAYVMPSRPVHQAQTATGGSFTSDGKILVVLLR
jgi:hypothetical protein